MSTAAGAGQASRQGTQKQHPFVAKNQGLLSLIGDYYPAPGKLVSQAPSHFVFCFQSIAAPSSRRGHLPRAASKLDSNLLKVDWHFALSPPLKSKELSGGTPWQPPVKHAHRNAPCLTANSKTCCNGPGNSFAIKKRRTHSTRRRSRPHGLKRYPAFAQRLESPGFSSQCWRRPKRGRLGFSRPDPLVGSGARRHLRRRVFTGPFHSPSLVSGCK
jgi:hypothetical protein